MELYNKTFKNPLPKDEQLKYIKLAQNGDKKAKELIVEHNLGLIASTIYENYITYNDEIKIDLFSVGYLTILKCIKNFKINNSNEFSTYAVTSINKEMKKFITNNNIIHIPRKTKELYTKIKKLQSIEKIFSPKELSSVLNVSEYEIIRTMSIQYSIDSLNEAKWKNYKDGERVLLKDTIPDNSISLYKIIEKKELYYELIEAIEKLTDIEKNIIKLYFGFTGEEKNQKEIAKIFNISQPQVSRIIKRTLHKIKKLLPKDIKEEYENNKTYSKKKV